MSKKYIKTDKESKLMFASAKLTVECMKYAKSLLKIGVSEIYVANKIKQWFKKHGCDGVSFEPIVAFGKNSANPHHEPTATKLTKYDNIVVDIGCIYKGWCSDMTRTFLPQNKYCSDLLKQIYCIVKDAHDLGIKASKPNIRSCAIDKVCRDYISKYGFGPCFIHSTGHGVGKAIHELPYLRKKGRSIMKNGMFFTIEPGIYIEGFGGVRIEDTITLKNNKIIILTK